MRSSGLSRIRHIPISLESILVYALILALVTYPIPSLRLELGGVRMPYFIPVLVVLVGLYVLRLLYTGRSARYPPLMLAAAWLFLIALLASSLFGSPMELGLVARYAVLCIIPFIVAATVRRPETLARSVGLLLVIGLALIVYGYYGFFTGRVGDPGEHRLGYFGIHYTAATRNGDAFYIASTFLLALSFWLFARKGPQLRLASLVFMVLTGGSLILSFSRGAWIATFASVAALLAPYVRLTRLPRLNRKLAILLSLVVMALLLLPRNVRGSVGYRLLTILDFSGRDTTISNTERLRLLGDTFAVIAHRPFVGVGVGNFPVYLQEVDPMLALRHAENAYLQMWTELGIAGFWSFVVLWLYPPLVLLRRFGEKRQADWVSAGLMATMLTWDIHSLFTFEMLSFYLWVVLGLGLAAVMLSNSQRQ